MTESQAALPANLSGQQYILLTTFRKSGAPVHTPVWFAERGGLLYVYTRAASGKVKRVRATGRVELAPCDARGTVHGSPSAGSARLLPAAEHEAARALFRAKYGLPFRLFEILGALQRAAAEYIEIAPAAS